MSNIVSSHFTFLLPSSYISDNFHDKIEENCITCNANPTEETEFGQTDITYLSTWS